MKAKLDKKAITQDELASRGEYFSARLMADFLGFQFIDAADWIHFRFDGTVDQESSYEALRILVSGPGVVIPGFYGQLPDGKIKTFTRGAATSPAHWRRRLWMPMSTRTGPTCPAS